MGVFIPPPAYLFSKCSSGSTPAAVSYTHLVANVLKQVRDAGITLYVITHDLELLLDCCTDIVHFELM